ncbi:hypothetical protein, partial [Parafrankia sp. EUN1f]|uniref:hypothetical protein n=1 Tax=Parafrankia sp. EUN1f TaxID=102897 RepID=UPI001E2A155E
MQDDPFKPESTERATGDLTIRTHVERQPSIRLDDAAQCTVAPIQPLPLETLQDSPELTEGPHGMGRRRAGRFMLVFGQLSSQFDLSTFAVLWRFFDAGA